MLFTKPVPGQWLLITATTLTEPSALNDQTGMRTGFWAEEYSNINGPPGRTISSGFNFLSVATTGNAPPLWAVAELISALDGDIEADPRDCVRHNRLSDVLEKFDSLCWIY